ncbi:MAG: membrane-bound serine protease (ClpP class) [Planctomycetota bacterium]|jgi:membrane-bound serine protease (ClpP class)
MTLAILLLGIGLALVVAEVLFPSFGVLSVLATVAIVCSLVVAFREDMGTEFLIATGLLVPIVMMLGLRAFPKSPMGKHMVLEGLSFDSRASSDERDLKLVGMQGVVEAMLRPAGIARIDGRRVDVVSRGDRIEPGSVVKVIEVEGNRVVVTRAAETEENIDAQDAREEKA